MANGQAAAIGLLLIILAVAAYITPISVTLADTTVNLTIPQVVAFCDSGLGQFAQISAQVVMVCSEYKNFLMGIYGAGIGGVILLIVGAVKSGNKELILDTDTSKTHYRDEEDDSLNILKERYAKGEISKDEFKKMKKDLEN